jgi:hypothetical protein
MDNTGTPTGVLSAQCQPHQELLDKGMQHNIQQTCKTNWTNLVVEMEQAIRQLETKIQDAYHILAAKKLKQLHYTLNSSNTVSKDKHI